MTPASLGHIIYVKIGWATTFSYFIFLEEHLIWEAHGMARMVTRQMVYGILLTVKGFSLIIYLKCLVLVRLPLIQPLSSYNIWIWILLRLKWVVIRVAHLI